MANEAYFPGIPETDKVKNSQYVIINNEKTGKPDKIRLDKFITNLNLTTDTTPTNNITSVTYSEAQTLITNSGLIAGEHYLISDKADAGIILLAVSTNQFSLEGQGIFLNPDFQDAGILTGSMDGVWYAGGEVGYVNTEVVIWNGFHYEVTDDGAFAGTNPSVTPLAYTLLPKSVANGYIEEVDFILYDFVNNEIIRRIDKRGNDWCPVNVTSFQAGNDSLTGLKVDANSDVDIINQRGVMTFNHISNSASLTASNDFIGNFSNNNVILADIIVEGNATVNNCIINKSIAITFETTSNYNGKTITYLGSNFEADLDMTDGDDYDAGTDTLTIPANLNYVGIFGLKDSSAQSIVKIANLPSIGEVEFRVADAGDTVVFTNTAIGLAVADNLVADVVGVNTLTGRTNGNDFIRYRKSGNLNVRTTGSIMA